MLESHVTGLPVGSENMLQKYKKMSNLDLKLLEDIYYIGNKETVQLYTDALLSDPSIFK